MPSRVGTYVRAHTHVRGNGSNSNDVRARPHVPDRCVTLRHIL